MTDQFDGYPQSLTEVRANKTRDCADWTPRDALIDLLRKIDEGLVVDSLVISYRTTNDDGSRTSFNLAAPDLVTGLDVMARAMFMMNEAAR